MQSVSSRIWTRVAVFIFYDNNHNNTGMKLTFMQIVIDALGAVTKELVQGLEDLVITGRVETVQTTTLLRSVRTLRWVLETWEDLQSLKIQGKTVS